MINGAAEMTGLIREWEPTERVAPRCQNREQNVARRPGIGMWRTSASEGNRRPCGPDVRITRCSPRRATQRAWTSRSPTDFAYVVQAGKVERQLAIFSRTLIFLLHTEPSLEAPDVGIRSGQRDSSEHGRGEKLCEPRLFHDRGKARGTPLRQARSNRHGSANTPPIGRAAPFEVEPSRRLRDKEGPSFDLRIDPAKIRENGFRHFWTQYLQLKVIGTDEHRPRFTFDDLIELRREISPKLGASEHQPSATPRACQHGIQRPQWLATLATSKKSVGTSPFDGTPGVR
jgi:hypothetical protein